MMGHLTRLKKKKLLLSFEEESFPGSPYTSVCGGLEEGFLCRSTPYYIWNTG